MPDRFIFDNGTEFNNPQMIDLCEKNAINLSAVIPANAPYSNGLCERNHAVVDVIMEKIKADEPNTSDQEALDYALYAKNMQTTRKGFSPFQIVYGTNPKIPGIDNANIASLNPIFASNDVRKHLNKIQLAREAFVGADNDERVK